MGSEREYQCAHCGGVFEPEWSEEEALAEASRDFPWLDPKGPDACVVCDDCYHMLRGAERDAGRAR